MEGTQSNKGGLPEVESVYKARLSKSKGNLSERNAGGSEASSLFSSVDLDSVPGSDPGVAASLVSTQPSLPTIDAQRICPNCGKEVLEPETKQIPSQRAWLLFAFMFFCLMWWISWIPFLINKCKFKKPVQMCPHCYRRLNRPPV